MTAPPRTERSQVTAAPKMVLQSSGLQRVVEQAERAAPTGCHVLILGERGVGKELLADHLHRHSGRTGRLVAVNCAAIQPSLVESTLFGHARGAFTGAQAASRGLVREASRGTLFLDEVGELPLDVQARLLRLLQEGVIQPVGEGEQVVDVRIVAATNRDLDLEVAAGRFRADLRDRLHLVALRVPPLRDRRAEIVPLAEHFLATARELDGRVRPALSRGAGAALRAHGWPGNVRELRNVVLRAAILGEGGALTARQVKAAIADGPGQHDVAALAPGALDGLQAGRRYTMSDLVAALRLTRGTAKRRVGAWVKRGALLVEGDGRRRCYRLPSGPAVADGPGASPAGGVQNRLIAWLRAKGPCSTGEVAAALDVPLTTLKRATRHLRASGLVEVSGIGRASRVRVVEPAGTTPPVPPPVSRPVTEIAPPSPPGTATESRSAEQEAVALRLAHQHGATTARALAVVLARSVRTAERVIGRLVQLGRLLADGFARARRYLPAVATDPATATVSAGPVTSTPGDRPVPAPHARPSLSLNGQVLGLNAIRVALVLAARPAGVCPTVLSQRGAVPEHEARRLLGTLGSVGLLSPVPGPQPRWRLQAGDAGATLDTS